MSTPGTTVVQKKRGAFLYLNIAYDGQQDSQTLTRFEAFMHQAKDSRQAGKS